MTRYLFHPVWPRKAFWADKVPFYTFASKTTGKQVVNHLAWCEITLQLNWIQHWSLTHLHSFYSSKQTEYVEIELVIIPDTWTTPDRPIEMRARLRRSRPTFGPVEWRGVTATARTRSSLKWSSLTFAPWWQAAQVQKGLTTESPFPPWRQTLPTVSHLQLDSRQVFWQ